MSLYSNFMWIGNNLNFLVVNSKKNSLKIKGSERGQSGFSLIVRTDLSTLFILFILYFRIFCTVNGILELTFMKLKASGGATDRIDSNASVTSRLTDLTADESGRYSRKPPISDNSRN